MFLCRIECGNWIPHLGGLYTVGLQGSWNDGHFVRNGLSVQRLKVIGKKHDFLTYEQVNVELPQSVVDPKKIAAVVDQLERAGIRVVEHPPENGTV